MAVALDYLLFRLPEVAWQDRHPALARWHDEMSNRAVSSDPFPLKGRGKESTPPDGAIGWGIGGLPALRTVPSSGAAEASLLRFLLHHAEVISRHILVTVDLLSGYVSYAYSVIYKLTCINSFASLRLSSL